MPLNECGWLTDKSAWLRKAVLDVVYPGALASRRTCLPVLQSFASERIGLDEGCMSEVFRVTLEWGAKGGVATELPSSLVLKLFTLDRMVPMVGVDGVIPDSTLRFLVEAHNKECRFYQTLMRCEDLPADVPLARCYAEQTLSGPGDSGPGLLLLQDFSARAANVAVVDGVSLAQAVSYAEGLARFHAYCLAHQDMLKGFSASGVGEENFYENWEERVGGWLAMAQTAFPDTFPKDKMDLLTKAFAAVPVKDVLLRTHGSMGMAGVLVNSDTWTGNLLFRKEKGFTDGQSPAGDLEVILDWQAVHVGCATTDLARLVWSSCQPEDRRKATDDVLNAYCATLETLRPEAAHEMPFQLFRQAYERLSVWAGVGAVAFTVLNFLHVKPVPDSDPRKKEKLQRALDRAQAAMDDVIALLPKLEAYKHLEAPYF